MEKTNNEKGKLRTSLIIHINRAFELQFGGDDLVKRPNRSTQMHLWIF